MKKILFLVILISSFCIANGQDWKTVNSGRKDYFISPTRDYNLISPQYDTNYLIKIIEVDSVVSPNGVDSIYYFFKTYLERCPSDSNGSWLGLKMRRNPISGKEYYATLWNDSVIVNTFASIGDTFYKATFGTQDVFLALVDSIRLKNFNGLNDSIKYGVIKHYKNGILFNNQTLDNSSIAISKQNGWIIAPQLFLHNANNNFNLQREFYGYGALAYASYVKMTKLENTDKQFKINIDLNELVQPGNEWRYIDSELCNSPFSIIPQLHCFQYTTDSIISILWATPDSVRTVRKHVTNYVKHVDTVSSQFPPGYIPGSTTITISTIIDTVIFNKTNKPPLGNYTKSKFFAIPNGDHSDILEPPMPERLLLDPSKNLFIQNFWMLDSFQNQLEVEVNFDDCLYYYLDSNNCLKDSFYFVCFESINSQNIRYTYNIGILEHASFVHNHGGKSWDYYRLLYLKTPNYNFGLKNVTLPVRDFTKSPFTIYPNPALQNISFTNANQIQKVVIKNLNGAIVKSQDNGFSMDISGLPSQLYLLQIVDKNGNYFYDKIVKE